MRARQIKIVDGITLFLCPKCLRWLPKDKFYKNTSNKNKITSYCRSCLQKYGNEKRIKNRGEVKIDIERGKRCADCTVGFVESNGYQVVCKCCAKRRILKRQLRMQISKHNEIDLKY